MLHFLSWASFTASSSLAFSSACCAPAELVELDAGADGLAFAALSFLGVAAPFAAAGLASFFGAIDLTVSFVAGAALTGFFGAKGAADFDVAGVETAFGVGAAVVALAGVTVALGVAVVDFTGATLILVEAVLLLAGATLALAEAVIDFAAVLAFGVVVALPETVVTFTGATVAFGVVELVLVEAALDFAEVAEGLACESFAAVCLMPSASLEAAVLLCWTVSILARVF
jgi:hypothetical protein